MISKELFSLQGKKILVTGAAGHLGRALCEYLVIDGATVFAVDIDMNSLDRLQTELSPSGDSLVTFAADLADETSRVRMAQSVSEQSQHLDGAVFAAAFVGTSALDGWTVDFPEQTLSTWRAAMELNLTAPFHLSQLLRGLLVAGTNPSIVNIGSIYGAKAPDWSLYEGLEMASPAAYAASKGGLAQLTRWLASTLSPDIRVNMVSPGGILRGQPPAFVGRYENKVPLGRMATEDDVVGPIVALLAAAGGYVTGQNWFVDGGLGSL